MTIRRPRARPLPLLLLAAVVALGALTSPTALLMVAPALALVALLLAGRTPAEELLLRLRRRGIANPRRRPAAAPQRRYVVLFARWSERMSASALAMRPPPAAPLRLR